MDLILGIIKCLKQFNTNLRKEGIIMNLSLRIQVDRLKFTKIKGKIVVLLMPSDLYFLLYCRNEYP